MSKNTLPETTKSYNPQPQTLNSKPGTLNSLHHWRLFVILLIYLVLATAHSYIVPLTTGNDEWAHFLYVRFIAENGRLPATFEERNEAGYKSDAPPLYHLLVAAATAGVEPTRLLRPLSSDQPRRYLADNIVDSYALVHTAVEQYPFRGEVLVWHLGRGLSILFGLFLIALTYLTSLMIFPGGYHRAATAAGLVAFIPAVIFHSSVLSYESFSAVMTALFLLAALKTLFRSNQWRWWLAMGLTAGLAITTKYSAVLLPVEILFVTWLIWKQHKHPLTFYVLRFSITGLALLLASVWWFGFVAWQFNTIDTHGPLVGILQPLLVGDASDTTSVQVADFLFGSTTNARPPLARNYPQLTVSLLESFWAAPVNGHFALSPWLPLLFTLLALLAAAGLWRLWRQVDSPARAVLLLLLFHTLLILPILAVRVFLSFDAREVAQGRHILLPAASAIAVLLVWGWRSWSPKIGSVVVTGLLVWSVFGQVIWAATVYPNPISVWPQPPPVQANAQSKNIAFLDESIQLTAADWQQTGNALAVSLWWEALKTVPEDYLIELILLDKNGQSVGYSLAHPIQGRYPTRAWEPGDIIEDTHLLPLAQPLSGNYQLALKLVTRSGEMVSGSGQTLFTTIPLNISGDSPACEVWAETEPFRPNSAFTVISADTPTLRPLAASAAMQMEYLPSKSMGNTHVFIVSHYWPAFGQVMLGQTPCGDELAFDIPPRNFAAPNVSQPMEVNFNNQIQLLGYDLPTRRIQPGERLPLTLYWRALDFMGEDYRIFANPLDANQQRWGGYDRLPQDGYSTLRWIPGQVITDPFGIPIDPTAPDGIYTIDVGLYRQTETGAESLPLYQDGQPLEQHSIRLGPIKIGNAPPDVVAQNPAPQIEISQSLSDQITLFGYDLKVGEESRGRSQESATDNSEPETPNSELETLNLELVLTLYWQANTLPAADYTTFVHLRDASNQTVAQKDGPPAAGRYPAGLWEPGEIIIDPITLPLGNIPPGKYTPVVGLYNPLTGERLLTPGNPANEIPLQTVQIANSE